AKPVRRVRRPDGASPDRTRPPTPHGRAERPRTDGPKDPTTRIKGPGDPRADDFKHPRRRLRTLTGPGRLRGGGNNDPFRPHDHLRPLGTLPARNPVAKPGS